jgi:hypothetical protein
MEKMTSEKLVKNLPSLSSLLKVSIGLIIVAIISFSFVYAETIPVDVNGTNYNLQYTGKGVSVSAVNADLDYVSLILNVDVPASGVLEITLDRTFFDSVYQGADEPFIVLADGDEPTYSEIETTTQSRTLSIQLPAGSEEVEIIGSVFGTPTEKPVECTLDYVPVCGIDGITYGNKCMLDAAAIPLDYQGECKVAPEPVEEPAPVKEPTPVEEPSPVKEPTPVVEKPAVEEKPKVECGEGTILKDGVCVLDERCGPGTVLNNGVCEAEPVPTTPTKGMGTQLIYALVGAFIIAGIVGVVLALMSKAGKSRD